MPPAFPVEIKKITAVKKPAIKAFDCANEAMTTYFHRFALTNHKSGLSPCHVLLPKGELEPILGYTTLSNASVTKGDPPEPSLANLPNYPIPVTLIGRLAISKDNQGQGLGKHFLMHIFYITYIAVKEHGLGSVGVITDAIDQNAVDFYSKYGFTLFADQATFPKRMLIPNSTIFDAIDG